MPKKSKIEESQFISMLEFANAIGVSSPCLRTWDKNGILKPHHRLPGGERIYAKSQIKEFFEKFSNDDDTWTQDEQ